MVKTAKSVEKLKKGVARVPFVKGFDPRRNLSGRPAGSVSIVEGIRRKLLEINPKNKKTWLETFLDKYFDESIKVGKSDLIRDMINRIDGMPKQHTDITSGDKPIPLLNAIHFDDSNSQTDKTD